MASAQYLYCIVEGGAPHIEGWRGVEGLPLETISYRDLSAVVSTLSHSRAGPTAENVVAHEGIVEALMEHQSLLPARFGTVLRDRPSVKATLIENRGAFRKGLDRVRGMVEMGVRILAPSGEPDLANEPWIHPAPTSGTSYLMGRLGLHARTRELRERLNSLAGAINVNLARHVAEGVTFACSGNSVMNGAYLVERERVAEFKGAVEDQRAFFPDLSFLLTGPWPAYSFVPVIDERTGVFVSRGLTAVCTN